MKKTLKITAILFLIIAILYLANRYFFSGKSFFQSIYLIPPDAVFIIESEAVFNAWGKIIHSNAWEQASHIEYFTRLNNEIKKVDSLLNNKKLLLKAIGKRKVLVSMHEYSPGKYDFLYVLNVGRASRLRNPEKILSSALGDDFRITKRNYENLVVYELFDIESSEMYIFSLVKDKIILSKNYKIVEASINEINKMTLGRDLTFIDVSKRISGKGLFNVYINYKYFPKYLRSTLGKPIESIDRLENELSYSAFSFDISTEGLISLEGFTGVNDSVSSFFTAILNAGSGAFKSTEIIPARVASMVKISFENASDYYKKSLDKLNTEEYEDYINALRKLEKKLKISIDENILRWIDDEIVLLQTQPSNLGRSNEFAAIIKAKNKKKARDNLDFLARQIERNTPVKIRKVAYKDYSISYISFPGLLKALFGKMLEKIEKPYYTIVNEYVIFSNHPQTLKNIIDDFKEANTLENSIEYYNFTKQFDKKQSVYTYLDVPVLYSNLREFVSAETWKKLRKNKPYITSFSKAGIQVDRKDDLLHFLIKTKYSETIDNYSAQRFDSESFLSLFTESKEEDIELESSPEWYDPMIIIHDLDATKLEEFYEDGSLKFSVGLKSGLKHGVYKELYSNGNIRIKGKYKDDLKEGSWKLYDEEGNLVEKKSFSEGKEIID